MSLVITHTKHYHFLEKYNISLTTAITGNEIIWYEPVMTDSYIITSENPTEAAIQLFFSHSIYVILRFQMAAMYQ